MSRSCWGKKVIDKVWSVSQPHSACRTQGYPVCGQWCWGFKWGRGGLAEAGMFHRGAWGQGQAPKSWDRLCLWGLVWLINVSNLGRGWRLELRGAGRAPLPGHLPPCQAGEVKPTVSGQLLFLSIREKQNRKKFEFERQESR